MLDTVSVPPPLPSIDDILPLFNIGDRVCTIPDSSPGVDRRQAEAFYRCIFRLKFDQSWHYNIQSVHSLRNFMWLPEVRVLPMSTSISDGSLEDINKYISLEVIYLIECLLTLKINTWDLLYQD